MRDAERRTVTERGRVPLPDSIRAKLGIETGDDVLVGAEDGRVVVEAVVNWDRLADGYRRRAARDRRNAGESWTASTGADEGVEDVPEW